MMEIVCNKCGKRYRIDENKLTKKKAKLSCKTCDNIIMVEKPEPGPDEFSQEPDSGPADGAIDYGTENFNNEDIDTEPAGKETSEAEYVGSNDETNISYRISWINRIQVRVTAILVCLTTMILLGFAAANHFMTQSKMEADLRQSAENSALRLSKNLVEPFWALDIDLLEDALKSEMAANAVHAVVIRDRDRKTPYIYGKKDERVEIHLHKKGDPEDVVSGNYTMEKKPIAKGNDVIGQVEVYLTPEIMKAELKRSLIHIIITVVILNFFIFLSIFYTLRKMIIRPIMKLTDAAERMSMGDLNVQFNIRSRNEIGLLVLAIERMQTSLRFAMERLGH